jgi:hypothetical protein
MQSSRGHVAASPRLMLPSVIADVRFMVAVFHVAQHRTVCHGRGKPRPQQTPRSHSAPAHRAWPRSNM